jgi:hypothetical protein
MLLSALVFAWFGARLRKARRQSRAIAVLQGLGAVYAYDFQGPVAKQFVRTRFYAPGSVPVAPAGRSGYSKRLLDLLGIDFLHDITQVHIESTRRMSDENVEQLWAAIGSLPNLVSLEASGPVTRPGAIRRLGQHHRLRRLALRWAEIADDDLGVLVNMARLEDLNLNETPVTDAALVHVGRATNLRSIELHHTNINGSGLESIVRLSHLQRLRLSGTEASDEGISHLGGHASLVDLDLEHTKITDRSLEAIADLPNLERLDLSLNAVTEAGVAKLVRLSRLKELRLQATQAGPAALATLPKLPALESLTIDGPIASGDLTPISECAQLQRLVCPLYGSDGKAKPIELPHNLVEISGAPLTDEAMFEQLAALPKLRVLRGTYSTFDPEQVAAVQRFKSARPEVLINNR